MRGESSGSRGGMMGEGGERGVGEIEGWSSRVEGRGEGKVVEGDHTNTYKCPSDSTGTTADEIKECEGSR